MVDTQPFRFGAGFGLAESIAAVSERARRMEALGYTAANIGDHFAIAFAPGPALTAAALATTTLRVGSTVFCSDFRHPAVLAKEGASIDVLSGGRFEFGIGAGWNKDEYDQAGIAFEPAPVRLSRMMEAVQVIKGLWSEEPFTFSGRYYTIRELNGLPKPLQQPHPPSSSAGAASVCSPSRRGQRTSSAFWDRRSLGAASRWRASPRRPWTRRWDGSVTRPVSASRGSSSICCSGT